IKENERRKGKTYEDIFGAEKAAAIKKKLSQSHKGQTPWIKGRTKETEPVLKRLGEIHSKRMRGRRLSENHRRRISEGNKGRVFTEETKRKIGLKSRVTLKKLWKNPEYRAEQVKRIISGWRRKPTRPEKRMIEIFEKHGLPFIYNGYIGGMVIGGKVPDFISTEGKQKVVEVFGRFFHDPNFPRHLSPIPESKTFQGTIHHYSQHGYDCLIFWEDQLKDENFVLRKVRAFIEG
ncbi:unnamed protein product, partial [marine sediment metagenome]